MLNGKELGAAIKAAIDMKIASGAVASQAAIARHFNVKPPSIHDWIKKGSIAKDKLPELWRYFSDVVGPEHWGLKAWPDLGTAEPAQEKALWPFPSIPEDQVRKLSPAQISALEGAIALASGQLKLGLAVAPACHEDHDEASNDNEYAFIDRIDAKLSAGRGKIIYHAERRSRLSFRRDWLRSQGITDPKRAVLTELEGRSMEETIPDGSTILIDLSRTEIINGKVYAIFHDGEFYVKRLFARGVIVTANSDTDDQATYPPFILTKESDTIIGRVFWCGFTL